MFTALWKVRTINARSHTFTFRRHSMKMTTFFKTAMITGLFSLCAAAAQAGDITARGPVSFSSYDMDNSGGISQQEFNTVREQRMEAAKASGRLGRGMSNAPSFADTDTDNNGQISASELQAMQANRGMGRGQGMGQGARGN